MNERVFARSRSSSLAVPQAFSGDRVNLSFFSWIWQIKGSVPLAPDQSSDEAFRRLEPLFHQAGTSHERSDDTLTFRKKDPAAQDKMSIFNGGVLRIKDGGSGSVLHYNLTSPALLFCFLVPLLFLAFAQVTIAIGNFGKTSAEQVEKKDKKEEVARQLHPIDTFLGAPAPEDPKKKEKDKSEDDKKPSPTSAYVFAAIFAALYVIGRVLEDRLAKRLFKRHLAGS